MKILITGASKGIGRAEAELLLNKGHELFLVASSLDSFAGEAKGATLFGYDLSSEKGVEDFIADVKSKTNSLDVLINNVGVMTLKKFEDMDVGEITHLLNVNLRAPLLITKGLLPLLNAGTNPHVVFMSSMAAKSSIVGESVYSATKGAVTNFAGVLRNELGGKVKVSTIHSWGINTWSADRQDLLKPEHIAEAVEFIITRPKGFLVESIDLSHVEQWRGGTAPWSPK